MPLAHRAASRARPGRVPRLSYCGLLLLALAGCAHSDPFPSGTVDDQGPRDPGLPLRLTRNGGADRFPAWLRDGSAFLYSYQDSLLPDRDRCLGIMRGAGGTRLVGKCIPGDLAHANTDAILMSAASSAGRIAWFETENARTLEGPEHAALRVGSVGGTARGTPVWDFPYIAPDGQLHAMPVSPAWLGDSTLAYVGAAVFNIQDCTLCVRDTVPVGRRIMLLHLGGAAPSLEPVPNTLEATSVDAAPDGSALYFTVAGSSLVLRRLSAVGTIDTVHDFGPGTIARDVSVNASALVAIVGGQVSYYTDPQYGPIQRDAGGPLYHVRLSDGATTLLSSPAALLRHPALSPDGQRIVVEQFPTASASPDLYLYGAP